MDHRFKQQRFSGGYARGVVARARAQGNVQTRNKAVGLDSGNGPPVDGQLDCRKNSPNKASGTMIETQKHEDMSSEKKVNHQQPSVIARLMGLDSMPSPHKLNEQKEFKNYLPQKTYKSCHGHSLGKNITEHQDCKDVFRIKDSKKTEKQKEHSNIKEYNPHVIQEAFIKHKFIEAKRPSTSENLDFSKELDDAYEVLDSKRDIFLKFLDEPNTLSANYLSGFPRKHQIKVSRLPKGKTHSAKSSSQVHKDPTGTLQKPNTNLFNNLLLEHSAPLSNKLEVHNLRKISTGYGSTNIVVLKPNSEKLMRRNVLPPTSQERDIYAYKRSKKYQYSGTRELHIEEEQHGLSGNVEYLGRRTKSSREIVKEIAMKRSAKSSCRFNRPGIKDESSHVFLYNSNNCRQHSENNSSFSNCSSRPSSPYSDKPFFSTEGKKHLSERWRLKSRLSYENHSDRHFTLNEVLNLTGKEGPNVLDSKRESYHSGLRINYTGSGMYQNSTSIPRSSSFIRRLKSPLITEGAGCYKLKDHLNLGEVSPSDLNLKTNQCSSKSSKIQNKPYLNPDGLENKKPARENILNREEAKNGICISDQYTEPHMLSRLCERDIANSINVLDSSLAKERSILDSKEHVQQHLQEWESSVINHTAELKVEISLKQRDVDNISSPGSSIELESIINCGKADNEDPISVLGCQSQQSESSPEYLFAKVSAGLQELQIQLQLLRESDNGSTENDTLVLSEDDSTTEFKFFHYKNEEDRDYSYVVDALTLLNPEAFQNSSLDHNFFIKLEEKYSKIIEWSKSERKLLFDLTSSIAETFLCRNRRQVSVFDTKSLNEVVWEMVVRQRKESGAGKQEDNVLDPKWLDLEDGIDVIGKEIAGMLMDDLLEEFVADF